MTVNDTTYFISEHKQFRQQGNQYQLTFKFIENTLYKRKKNYTVEEITQVLENINKEKTCDTT